METKAMNANIILRLRILQKDESDDALFVSLIYDKLSMFLQELNSSDPRIFFNSANVDIFSDFPSSSVTSSEEVTEEELPEEELPEEELPEEELPEEVPEEDDDDGD
jgi:hypothetical protein